MRDFALFALVSVTLFGASSALVEAGDVTTVSVDANAYDERTSGAGCSPSGCTPENTRDGIRSSNSRWSCMEDLEDENCEICYDFDEPQHIERMRIAFHKGNERIVDLVVTINGLFWDVIKSSGTTNGYQSFALDTSNTHTLCLLAACMDSDEWISIKEVQFMVE